MSTIPLDLQRRFEQRWAARFPPSGVAVATRWDRPKKQDQQLATLKGKRKNRQANLASPVSLKVGDAQVPRRTFKAPRALTEVEIGGDRKPGSFGL
jgi:hypothetical protein